MDLALNNLQWLICHKSNQPTNNYIYTNNIYKNEYTSESQGLDIYTYRSLEKKYMESGYRNGKKLSWYSRVK